LTWSTHESFNYELCKTGHRFDFLIPPTQVPWRDGWDSRSRPLPSNARLIGHTPDFDLPSLVGHYDVALCQTLEQFLLVERFSIPKVFLAHGAPGIPPEFPSSRATRAALQLTRRLGDTPIVYVGQFPRKHWELPGIEIAPLPDPADYVDFAWHGDEPAALTVGHHMVDRPFDTGFHVHQQVVRDDIPHVIVGNNPKTPGAVAAPSWDDLRRCYQRYRCYLSTTPSGGSMAAHEAATAGMPLVVLDVPGIEFVTEHGVHVLRAPDAEGLRREVRRLLDDHELARQIGAHGRENFLRRRSFAEFLGNWDRVLRSAVSVSSRRADTDPSTPGAACCRIEVDSERRIAKPGTTIWLEARLTNLSLAAWPCGDGTTVGDVAIGYHLHDAHGRLLDRGGEISSLERDVGPGHTIDVDVRVSIPCEAGSYRLRLDLVRSGLYWFSERGMVSPWVDIIVQ
jgi:hypothetical protein